MSLWGSIIRKTLSKIMFNVILFRSLSAWLVKIDDDDDSESGSFFLACVYDYDFWLMLIFCDEVYVFTSSDVNRSSCFVVTLI